MCLKSKKQIIKNLGTPIECYKVLCDWGRNEVYSSPTKGMRYHLDTNYQENRFVYDDETGDGYTRYYTGFHVLLNYQDAVRYLKRLVEYSEPDVLTKLKSLVILRCEIPVNAYYCFGTDSSDDSFMEGVCYRIKTCNIVARFDKNGNVIEENSNSAI